jgi:processive 1,2-diacylglycerol beta-glucosyltransferase
MKSVCVYSCGTQEHALGHLRICSPLRRAGVQVRWYRLTDEFSPRQIAGSDLVIIQRDFPRDLARYTQIINQAYRHRKPVVFEIDDLLWDLPSDHPDRLNHHYLDSLWPMLLAALSADAVTVASPSLQEFMRSLNHPSVYQLPNFFDDDLWELRTPEGRDESMVRIGYMGGDSHTPDIEMILPVLKRILQRYESRVRLIFWGLKPPEEIRFYPNVEWHALNMQDYAQFANYFLGQELDIFLAPLRSSRFNDCKSPVKYFECTAIGGAGICSDIAPYQQVVVHGQTGYLAGSVDEWAMLLGELIENHQLRLEMVRHAQENIRNTWLLSDHYQEWPKTYQQIIDDYRPRNSSELWKAAASIQEQWLLARRGEGNETERKNPELQNQLEGKQSGRIWKVMHLLRTWRK